MRWGRRSGVKLLPDDPLVKWLVWLMLAVSVGIPVIAALVMTIER
jgi:hypothetical protein